MTYGGTQQLNASIRAYKAYQERTGEDCTAKIAELEGLRNRLIEENRITCSRLMMAPVVPGRNSAPALSWETTTRRSIDTSP